MKLKVCGMREADQVSYLSEIQEIDYLGFIFYEKSKRFTHTIPTCSPKVKKVGVFVNELPEKLLAIVVENDLQLVQLHGEESALYCEALKKAFSQMGRGNLPLIKAFPVGKVIDFKQLRPYLPSVDFFLFDTQTEQYGGSGKRFNWSLLEEYPYDVPFFISGGISPNCLEELRELTFPMCHGIDINSGFEESPGNKNCQLIKEFVTKMKKMNILPDSMGFYGSYGGAYVPELLRPNLLSLEQAYRQALQDPDFAREYLLLLKQYVGRPSALYFSKKLSEEKQCKVFLKREDLNHTGSHKINNAIGQALLAKRMGKRTIVAETGAGQHGVATATVCALLDLECIVFMGEKDMQRQAANVKRMRFLGAKVIPASSGSKTLKDATNEAIRYWINHVEAYYLIGSVVGPHPYPELVTYFQSVISKEIKAQLQELCGSPSPSHLIACVGGGSNAAGAFYEFYNEKVQLIAVEAAGLGTDSLYTAATAALGSPGVLHGSYTLLLQDKYGQIMEPHSISAGLDYPGIGPMHAHAIEVQRCKTMAIRDEEALEAAQRFARQEGIIPALESAHALAALYKLEFEQDDIVVLNLSGRGEKDMETYLAWEESGKGLLDQ